jgi:hypothetical protein
MPSSPQPTTYLSTVLNPHSPPPRASFSATQRSLQARHKDANVTAGSRKARDAESYENRQKREEAATVLDSTEMLIWWSGVRNEVCLRLLFFFFFSFCSSWLHSPQLSGVLRGANIRREAG